jgi:hypothetical protein
MGPPKKRPPRLKADQIKERENSFQYRWNTETGVYDLFNPYTGEVLVGDGVDRTISMWTTPDRQVSSTAAFVSLYPTFYCSRRWGRRRFTGWASLDDAATHIVAVIRGFMVRLALRHYIRHRYQKIMDKRSGYYYFIDFEHSRDEPSWHKPLLAFPGDIEEQKHFDESDDYMQGQKYSLMSYLSGPWRRLTGLGKGTVAPTKADPESFLVSNPWRAIAVSTPEEIDLEKSPMGSIVSWLDGSESKSLLITEYAQIRSAICDNDWSRVLRYMTENEDNVLSQVYGYLSFAKSEVPLDATGILDFGAGEAMARSLAIVDDTARRSGTGLLTIKVFAFYALHNILATKAGRSEYLSLQNVTEQGDKRQEAIEHFLFTRFGIFTRYLKRVPMEVHKESGKGARDFHEVHRPTPRGADLAHMALKVHACVCKPASS